MLVEERVPWDTAEPILGAEPQTETKGKIDEAHASIEELQKELKESRELVATTQDQISGAAGSAQEEERRLKVRSSRRTRLAQYL